MNQYFISLEGIRNFIAKMEKRALFGPIKRHDVQVLVRADEMPADQLIFDNSRLAASFKNIVFPQKERVAEYGPLAATSQIPSPDKFLVLLGLKDCDLQALAVLDKIFLDGEFVEPFYQARRESLFIISSDCVEFPESCFGNLVGIEPFPTTGFDLNLSPVKDGFVVEIGTQKGQNSFLEFATGFRQANEAELLQRSEQRKHASKYLQERNGPKNITNIPLEQFEEKIKQLKLAEVLEKCVECAGCTSICPTCHCFYLYDQAVEAGKQFERIKAWDSCLLSDYSRMAGANHHKMSARPQMNSRIQNRLFHKFVYIPENQEMLGCTGCGRCIEACLGKIDLKEIVNEVF